MIPKQGKKTYNSIVRSFRSKPCLNLFVFFSKNWRKIKKLKQKPGDERDIPQQNIFTITT